MPTMKLCVFVISLVFSMTKCLVLPVHISGKDNCPQQSLFKAIQCECHSLELTAEITFGAINNPQVIQTAKVILDTGSWSTWLITNYTELLDQMGHKRSWNETFHSTIPRTNYAPEALNRLNIVKNQSYNDGVSLKLEEYANYKLEFPDDTITVPMNLYFAQQYIVPDCTIPLFSHGILGLRLSMQPGESDINNCFLHKYRSYFPNNCKTMMSFDVNWDDGNGQTSYFGLGKSLPIKENLHNPPLDILTCSNFWAIAVTFVQLDFHNGKRIIIKLDTEYTDMGSTVYVNTKGMKNRILYAIIDSGDSEIKLSEYLVEQTDSKEQEFLVDNYHFNCDDYLLILPTITIGVDDGNITILPNKLYKRINRRRCYPLMGQSPFYIDKTTYFTFGLPFFTSNYIEMIWKDTRNIMPADWLNNVDFNAIVKVTPK